MQWLRNWLTQRPTKSSPAVPNTFRPRVESLDDRIVPTVSTAITNVGTITLAVNTDHVLVALDATGNQIVTTNFTNVRTAQAFRDANGGLGADIVFRDGSWTHFDNSLGGITTFSAAQAQAQFGGRLLDVGTAYDDNGLLRIDLLVANNNLVDTNGNTFSDALGSVLEFNQATGGGLLNLGLTNTLWVSAYNAVDGTTGIALGQLNDNDTSGDTSFGDTLLVRKFDIPAGLVTLYNGDVFSGGAVEEYSQTTSLNASNGLGGLLGGGAARVSVIIDVTFEGSATKFDPVTFASLNDGGYALQFSSGSSDPNGGGLLGTGVSLVPNVVGIISPNGTIKTGILYPDAQFTP